MDKLIEINEIIQKGRAKIAVKLVKEALDSGIKADTILKEAI